MSRTRYRTGLVIFVMPLVFGWLTPYVSHVVSGYGRHHIVSAVVGDIALLVGLFVLDSDFWDKVRALFFYGANAQFFERKWG